MEKAPKKISFFNALFICLNCAVGASIFGIPWSFTKVGWVFSIMLCLIGFAILSMVGVIFLQIISRMNKLKKYEEEGYVIAPVPFLELFQKNLPSKYIKNANEDAENFSLVSSKPSEPDVVKFDLILICRTLLGSKAEKVLIILIVFQNIIFSIGCTSTFASSLVSSIPIGRYDTCNIFINPSFADSCRYKYMFYILIFAVITIVMSMLLKMTDQQNYLTAVCIARIVVLLLMVITVLILIENDQDIEGDGELDPDLPLFEKTGFGIAAPIIFLSMGFHVLIPDLIESLEDKKKKAAKLILTTIFFALVLISIVGFCCIFGLNKPEPLITLNWKDYSNGEDLDDRVWWHYMVGGIISVFPAVDVTSIFALNIINCADNINSLRRKSIKFDEDQTLTVLRIRAILLAIALILPIYFYDLGVVFALSGCFSMITVMCFIPAIGIASLILVPEKCCYDNFLTSKKIATYIFLFGVVFMIALWVNFVGFFFY